MARFARRSRGKGRRRGRAVQQYRWALESASGVEAERGQVHLRAVADLIAIGVEEIGIGPWTLISSKSLSPVAIRIARRGNDRIAEDVGGAFR